MEPGKNIENSVCGNVWDDVEDDVFDSTEENVWIDVSDGVWANIWARVEAVRGSIEDDIREPF